ARECRADEPESNPLLYTLYMESLTRAEGVDLDDWLRDYARRRYGTDQAEGAAALRLLCDTAYAQQGAAPGSVFCMRPAMRLEPTGPGDGTQAGYHSASLLQCANLLLQVNSEMPGWEYDLCDILRQALSAKARECYLQAMEGFHLKDARMFERGANDFLALLEDCDRLLRREEAFTLDYHLGRARGCAKMDAERNNFELVMLLQHSLYGAGGVHKKFGYQLYGQAWREWGGLLGSLCAKRWRGFFSHLAAHFGGRRFSLDTKQRPLGRTAYAGNRFYEEMSRMELDWMRNYKAVEGDGEEEQELREMAGEMCRKYGKE
ncbi:MAG: alpha-N-acetylglucosaminidase C-terminal domain-containing protein, partial [Firmicutes bacterium]|nr:alpha-N-acetylglucosaminidase C-terminal domain-containing protein [Bacillota bacterium]